MMKNYVRSLSALLLCIVLLVGCGKSKSFDITEYLDAGWATKDLSPQYYELYLATYMLEGTDGTDTFVDLTFCYYQNAGNYNVAEIFATFDSAEFTSNVFTFNFADDGWGNSGEITLTFNKDNIDVAISNLQSNFGGEWGFTEDNITLYKNADMADGQTSPSGGGQNYDTSTASGILASMGMTEQEFKDSCLPLEQVHTTSFEDQAAILAGDILDNPSQYYGLAFKPDNRYGVDWCKVDAKGMSDDGYIFYEDSNGPNYLIFDFRDDPYAPTLSEGELFVPYMIFTDFRTDSWGDDWLVFWMLSMDTVN